MTASTCAKVASSSGVNRSRDASEHGVDIALHETVIAVELVRELEMILAPVGVGILLDDIALADQVVDLVGRVGLRDAEKVRKPADRRRVELMNDLNGKRLHCAQRALTFPHL